MYKIRHIMYISQRCILTAKLKLPTHKHLMVASSTDLFLFCFFKHVQTKVLSAGLIFFFLIVFCFSLISFINKNVFNGLNSLKGLSPCAANSRTCVTEPAQNSAHQSPTCLVESALSFPLLRYNTSINHVRGSTLTSSIYLPFSRANNFIWLNSRSLFTLSPSFSLSPSGFMRSLTSSHSVPGWSWRSVVSSTLVDNRIGISGATETPQRSPLRVTTAAAPLQPAPISAHEVKPAPATCISESVQRAVFCLAWGEESLQAHFPCSTEVNWASTEPFFYPVFPFPPLALSLSSASRSPLLDIGHFLFFSLKRRGFPESTCLPSTHEFRKKCVSWERQRHHAEKSLAPSEGLQLRDFQVGPLFYFFLTVGDFISVWDTRAIKKKWPEYPTGAALSWQELALSFWSMFHLVDRGFNRDLACARELMSRGIPRERKNKHCWSKKTVHS